MRIAPFSALTALAAALAVSVIAWPVTAAPAAPALTWPPDGHLHPNFAPTFQWTNPPGATQYQIQVLPANGDGPGLNLIRGLEEGFAIAPPVLGEGNYILLPDMGYTWRVRVSDAAESIGEGDASWGPWPPARTFRTPRVTERDLTLRSPESGANVGIEGTTLRWTHADAAIFYYEVQVSPDPEFRAEAAAVAPVWWNLVHGGVTAPLNSWKTPALESGTVYYWRVRPRIQGDGTPSDWTSPLRFTALPAAPCCRVTMRVDNQRPLENTSVRVTGRLMLTDGTPVAGVPLTVQWRFPQQAWLTCTGPATDSNGESSCSRNVGRTSGETIPIEVQFNHQAHEWTAQMMIFPR